LFAAGLLALSAAPAAAQRVHGTDEEIVKQVRLEQKLDAPLPLDAPLKDEDGKDVKLGDYFGEKPVMMMLIQFRCTMLCTEQVNILLDSLKRLKFTPGKEFNLLIVSIDPREKPDLAAEMKASFVKEYRRPESAPGIHFLTTDEKTIDRVASAVGFRFAYVQKTDQFAHPDGVIIATPAGHAARYFFRLEYPARFLRYGLIEAAQNKISTPLADAIALLCFHYNPTTGTYTLGFMKVLRIAAVATVLLIALSITMMRRRERPVAAVVGAGHGVTG
jgi:protein SCO1